MNTAGIIGGLGPETTADFYLNINRYAETHGATHRPACLVWNVPLPYAVEQELLLQERGIEKYLPYMIEAAVMLQDAGADFIAVPCNTVHELYDQYRDAVDIPVLHIVEETTKYIHEQQIREVGILATGQTIRSRLYQDGLRKVGINFDIPTPSQQKNLNDIVARLVSGRVLAQDRTWLVELLATKFKDTEAVVLGCTDFHILLSEHKDALVVDSMDVLSRETARRIVET